MGGQNMIVLVKNQAHSRLKRQSIDTQKASCDNQYLFDKTMIFYKRAK